MPTPRCIAAPVPVTTILSSQPVPGGQHCCRRAGGAREARSIAPLSMRSRIARTVIGGAVSVSSAARRLGLYLATLPDEGVWGRLRYGVLANHVPDGLGDLDDEIIDRLIELKLDPDMLRALWEASEPPSTA